MASNISVAITVDNKQYIAGISAANSATQKFGQTATKSFNDIGIVSNNLVAKLGGLKTALTALVGATAIQSANNFANAIKDISVTSDLSIESVLGLSRAFEVNGGSAEGAQQAILKFADNIAQARAGNQTAIKSFNDVGISMDMLNKNGIEELTKKSIAGIAGLSSATAQIRGQTDLFGKSAKAVSFGGVQKTQQGQFISPETVAALKSGADASENMKKQFGQLTDALLRVAKPLNDIVASINITATAFQSLITAIVAAISAYLLFGRGVAAVTGVASTAITAIRGAGGAIAVLTGPIKAVVKDLGSFVNMWTRVITGAKSAASGFGAIIGSAAILGRVLLRFAGFVGIIIALAEAVNFLSKQFFNFDIVDAVSKKFDKLIESTKKLFGIKPPPDTVGGGRGGNAETLRLQQERGDAMKKAYDEEQAAVAATKKRYLELQQEISKVGEALQRNYNQKLKDIEVESFLIGKTNDQIEAFRAMDEAAKQADDAVQSLNEKRKEFAKGTPDQQAQVGFIDAEIERVIALGRAQTTNALNAVTGLQKVRMLENNRLQELKNIFEVMEQIAQAQEDIANFQIQQGSAKEAAFEQLDAQKQSFDLLTRREQLERGILNMREQDKTAAMALFELENDRKTQLEAIQKIQNLPFEGVGGMKQRLQEINDLYDARLLKIKETQERTTQEQESFSFGWAQATEKYRNSITTNAEYATKQMQNFTKGIEDVFVNFVRTGKLSFKDLANSMIADFARIQAQKAIAGIFGGGGGFNFGSLFGSIGKIFGFANGGMPPVGVPSLVGERGPELFVPQSAGRIVPNNALGGTTSNTVNNTAVTYAISAVDAQSFKSMLARDPEFIHNVAEQGRRSMPIRSRR